MGIGRRLNMLLCERREFYCNLMISIKSAHPHQTSTTTLIFRGTNFSKKLTTPPPPPRFNIPPLTQLEAPADLGSVHLVVEQL